jgi:hypothetical protein
MYSNRAFGMSTIYHLDTVKFLSMQIKKLFMLFYYKCLAIKNVSSFMGSNKTQSVCYCEVLKIKFQYVAFFLLDEN